MTALMIIVGVVFIISSGVAALSGKIVIGAAKEFGKDIYEDFKEGMK